MQQNNEVHITKYATEIAVMIWVVVPRKSYENEYQEGGFVRNYFPISQLDKKVNEYKTQGYEVEIKNGVSVL